MRIMTVLGSPRRQGNTAKVLGWVEEQFRADDHEVDSADILDYHVQGCGECMACKRGTPTRASTPEIRASDRSPTAAPRRSGGAREIAG